MLKAGRLDRIVTIRQATETQDNFGQPIKAWADLATVWASRVEFRGAETWAAKQFLSTLSGKYWIRYREDVTVQMRLLDGSEEFNIHAVTEIGRKEGLELTVSTMGV